MIIEYSIYDISLSDDEIRKNIQQAITFKPSTIGVFAPQIRLVKALTSSTTGIKIACSVDYPFGILDTKTRGAAIETAIKNGATIINVVAQPYNFCNRKYEKFRDDIKYNKEICEKYSVELRYILEYRVFTYELLYKVAQILIDHNINTIYPSTGYALDDINDNILASALINKKVPINIICNGNIWNISQIQNIKKANLYGLKVNSLNGLELITQNNSTFENF
jgi:deoxyribose-phosphate aldolase